MRYPLALFAIFLAFSANAVTVTVNMTAASYCGQATGVLEAFVSGGVPPYNLQWSNGLEGTSAFVAFGLSPGTYSVTVTDASMDQASAQGEVTTMSSYAGIPLYEIVMLEEPITCGSEWPALILRFANQAAGYDPYGTFGPGPYSITTGSLDNVWAPLPECDGIEGLVNYLSVDVEPGSTINIGYQDGAGCAGSFQYTFAPPMPDPNLGLLDVVGSCSGASNGTASLAYGGQWPFPGQRQLLVREVGATDWMDPCAAVFLSNVADVVQLPGLAAGDYEVGVFPKTAVGVHDVLCPMLNFSIPDLGVPCGLMSGRAFMDYNLNCTRQTNEPYVPGGILEIQPGPIYLTTNSVGFYSAALPAGSYTIEQQSDLLGEHCSGGPIPFVITVGQSTTANLPDTSAVPLDVKLSMTSGIARPGFEFQYGLNVRNLTPAASGATSVTFEFDPTLNYLSATPSPSNVSGNTITWNQTQLSAWQSRSYTIRFQVPPDVGLLGSELVATASVTTANTDGNLANNTATNLRTITGAYDPNDKLAYTSSGSSDVWQINTDEWIDYTIRFQNTGTDTAFNVVITDTLPATLDPGTIIMGAASHAITWDLRGHGILKIDFSNILLPDSNVNEPMSHGFVGFRIKPQQPVLPGSTIENTANIFFDFNEPVITEPSILTVTSPGVAIRPKVLLGGPYDQTTQRMGDGLRTAGLVPLAEPYTAMGYPHVGGGGESTNTAVLAVSGDDAIVDWVVVELRSPTAPYDVVASRSALLQRDGDVVAMNGSSPVQFFLAAGPYQVAVRHRNHLGCMTANAVNLGPIPESVDLSIPGTLTYGTDARSTVGARMVLWPGDCTSDGTVKYTGAGNDRDRILTTIDSIDPTTVVEGYHTDDANMDGAVKYTGAVNDRDIILQIIGGVVPTSIRVEQLP